MTFLNLSFPTVVSLHALVVVTFLGLSLLIAGFTVLQWLPFHVLFFWLLSVL